MQGVPLQTAQFRQHEEHSEEPFTKKLPTQLLHPVALQLPQLDEQLTQALPDWQNPTRQDEHCVTTAHTLQFATKHLVQIVPARKKPEEQAEQPAAVQVRQPVEQDVQVVPVRQQVGRQLRQVASAAAKLNAQEEHPTRGQARQTPPSELKPAAHELQQDAFSQVKHEVLQGQHSVTLGVATKKEGAQAVQVVAEVQLTQLGRQAVQTPPLGKNPPAQMMQPSASVQLRQLLEQLQHRLISSTRYSPGPHSRQVPLSSQLRHPTPLGPHPSVRLQRLSMRVQLPKQKLQVVPSQVAQLRVQQREGSPHSVQSMGEEQDRQFWMQQEEDCWLGRTRSAATARQSKAKRQSLSVRMLKDIIIVLLYCGLINCDHTFKTFHYIFSISPPPVPVNRRPQQI